MIERYKIKIECILKEIELVKKEISENNEYINSQILKQENLKGYLEGLEFALEYIDIDVKF